ncbi:response regulator transcription factor [Streptomyces sp. NPDC048106]|uniref:response regulator transcription factor n=1 Tax=Streptomyces sp. NPDC048106 TaxID=3155750 RepID=UPI003451FAC4
MIRVLVVDDNLLIRAGLLSLLHTATGIRVVGEASYGEEAVACAAGSHPDVILIDIQVPGAGISVIERILAQSCEPRPSIVVLTTFDRDESISAALRAGASGFLLKDDSPERLVAAVTAAARGDLPFAPSIARRLVDAYVKRAEPAAHGSSGLHVLTTREREVLRLTAKGLSNNEIAETLVISEATVKSHLNRTMTKLRVSSRAQAVVFAYETGLVVPRGGRLRTATGVPVGRGGGPG